jgi:hypothetical protein
MMGAVPARQEPIATIGGNGAASDDPLDASVDGTRGSCDCAQDDGLQ